MSPLTDPRPFPVTSLPPGLSSSRWHTLVEASGSGATGLDRERAARTLHDEVVDRLAARELATLVDAVETAPSAACCRQLLRAFDAAWDDPRLDGGATVIAHGFAIPVILVLASEQALEHPLVLDDVSSVSAVLDEHGVLSRNAAYSLFAPLVGSTAVGLPSLARWLDWRSAATAGGPRGIDPAPARLVPGAEGAHLRFLIGAALAAPGVSLLRETDIGRWGTPLAKALGAALDVRGVQLLALPRPAAGPIAALRAGQLAHREIALNLFASNAIRSLRANFGEPSAVVSSHRSGPSGELRVSLSSPFGERDAEGFRCPLFPYDRLDDVVSMIVDLMRACRISDIRVVAGVNPDCDPVTGTRLFYRADSIGPGQSVLH